MNTSDHHTESRSPAPVGSNADGCGSFGTTTSYLQRVMDGTMEYLRGVDRVSQAAKSLSLAIPVFERVHRPMRIRDPECFEVMAAIAHLQSAAMHLAAELEIRSEAKP